MATKGRGLVAWHAVSLSPLAQFIEDDGELFFTEKLPTSAKSGHFFGLGLDKISICGVILVTRCHSVSRRFSTLEKGDFSKNSGVLQFVGKLTSICL